MALNLSHLDGTNGFRLKGIGIGDQSGLSVAGAGDVNGDGIDDLIVGARYADPGDRYAAGESYVVFGTAAGFEANLDLSSLDGTNGRGFTDETTSNQDWERGLFSGTGPGPDGKWLMEGDSDER